MTWSDYNNKKGFHIFDTETREIEFISNPYTIFKKLMYNDTETNYDKFDITDYNQKYVKLVVVSKKDESIKLVRELPVQIKNILLLLEEGPKI